MQQLIQDIRNGQVTVITVPTPVASPGHLTILNRRSLISAGTEKSAIALGQKTLIGKARERPDHVRRVLEKIRNEGLINTVSQVREKLSEPMKMGYCAAGVVIACGAGVQGFKPGDRVASNGPHAGVVAVPKNLCALVPDSVSFDQAAFAVLGAVALQGVRLAHLGLGDTAFVIGLGLLGQITVALLRAQGCRVLATDLDGSKCELALRMGAEDARTGLGASAVAAATRGLGADAVLITAASKGDGPVELAAEAVRQKGRVVAVGAVGMNLPRRPFYFKEAEFVVSCSYGPGRYDPDYEERGHDYPPAYVRWTEQRNMQAILDLMASGRLDLSPLITHRFPIEQAEQAYEMIEKGTERYLGILLEYPEQQERLGRVALPVRAGSRASERLGVGVLGAGNFARMVLLPAIAKCPDFEPRVLCSSGGLSAVSAGPKFEFTSATSDENEVLAGNQVDAVFVLTRHSDHASQVVQALRQGKHVFVEKPLAIDEQQLFQIEQALSALPDAPLVSVGFNRRFSPAAIAVRKFLDGLTEPLTVSVRFNAGQIPPGHWTQDATVGGGRIIGEACHAIDLATFLTGSPPVRVFAESIGGLQAPSITDDQCFITLRHANGSISSIGYLAGGDKAFPKERVEVIGAGVVAVIDDFREVVTCSKGRTRRHRLGGQDKGHKAEIAAFALGIRSGRWPIPWKELHAVTLASILAVRSLREGVPFDVPASVLVIQDNAAHR